MDAGVDAGDHAFLGVGSDSLRFDHVKNGTSDHASHNTLEGIVRQELHEGHASWFAEAKKLVSGHVLLVQ